MSTSPSIYRLPPRFVERVFKKADRDQQERIMLFMENLKIVPHPQIKSISLEEKIKLETDFSYFCREAWKFTFPLTDLIWSWHYDLISEYLQLVKNRQLQRVIFNVPPRSLKTWQISVFFPCWCWISQPEHSFLCASYSRDLSSEHSIYRRNLITSAWYQGLWGDKFRLSPDRNLTTQFSNDKAGQMIATSTGSGAEGRGGDTAILDDPMSSQQALSDVERMSANQWVTNTLFQRLNNPRTASIILIMQRLHELDTTGYVLEQEPGEWQQVVIPLVAEEKKEFVFPISGKVHLREKGEVLQPDRFTPKVVEAKQKNRLVYAGQYQQRPAPLEGNLIKRVDVKYYGGRDPLSGQLDESLPSSFDRILISVDCAFKDLETSDYVAIGSIGVKGRKRFLLNVINEHLDVDGTETAIKEERSRRKANGTLVEMKANGPAVVQRLKKQCSGIIEIEPQGSKIARMFAASPAWQAGDWYVDRNAAWAEPFIQQITMFPMAAHDDMADMMTQADAYIESTGASGVYRDSMSEELLYDDQPWMMGEGTQGTVFHEIMRSDRSGCDRFIAVFCQSGRKFVCLDVIDDGKCLWIDREHVWDASREGRNKTEAQHLEDLKSFRVDSYGAVTILSESAKTFEAMCIGAGIWVATANEDQLEGIKVLQSLMAMKRVKIHRRCMNLWQSLDQCSWDDAARERGAERLLTVNDEEAEALRIAVGLKVPMWRLAA